VAPLKTADMARWQKVLDVNLTGPMLGIKAALEPMIAAGGGSIINISSIVGKVAFPFQGPYCASKHAVEALSGNVT
jgi:3alpha(or 20beta)-hydroxysteroid dehydrogenase